LRSFSYVFDELTECDERQYIDQTVARYGYQATYIPCDDQWTLRDLDTWPVVRDYLAFDPYPRLPLSVMQAAQRSGCRLLMSGFYGDMLFAGARFWLHSLLAGGRWRELARVLRSSYRDVNWQRLLVADGLYRYTPRPIRQAVKRGYRPPALRTHPALHPDLVKRTAQPTARAAARPARRLGPIAAARCDSLMMATVAQGVAAGRQIYASSGLELVMPYWDRRLLEFALAVPADQLGRPGNDRTVLRNALASDLPPAILRRRGRTRFVPLMQRGLLEREPVTVAGLLRSPRIVADGYVRREWLEQAWRELPAWSANVTTLWCCLCLELWLRRYW
jgi:asparagine synthase (glutamine-hydrolysing)